MLFSKTKIIMANDLPSRFLRWSAALGFALLLACAKSPAAKEKEFLENGKKALAARDYARAGLEFRNAAQAVKSDAEPYYQLALVDLATGDSGSAYQLLKKATQLNPKHIAALSALAELLASSGSQKFAPDAEKAAKQALEVSPNNPAALESLALLQLREGKTADAEQYLEQALNNSPDYLRAAVLLAKVKSSTGDIKGAEQVLKQSVAQDPKNNASLIALGNFYAAIGRSADAIQTLQSALKVKPNDGVTLASLAQAQFKAGQNAAAGETLHQLSLTSDPAFESLYGRYLLLAGKSDAAVKEFERLYQKYPKDSAARSRLVQTYLSLNRRPEAERIINDALKRNPKDASALIERSSIYIQDKKYNEAQADLNEALRYEPKSAEAHFLLSRIHRSRGFLLGQRQELTDALNIDANLLEVRLELAENLRPQSAKDALDILDKAPRTQARTPGFIAERNRCLMALGRDEELQTELNRVLKVYRTPDLLVQDGLLKMKTRHFDEARASFAEALGKDPTNPQILDLLGDTYLAQGQAGKAVAAIEDQAKRYPKSPRIQQVLGFWLMNHQQLEGARRAFNAAKSADPSYDEADIALGMLSMREQKLDEASKHFSNVLEKKPLDATARYFLAMVDDQTGAYPLAIANYRELVTQQPDNALFLNALAWDLVDHAQKADEALPFAEKAKQLAPKDPRVADTLGWIYYQKGVYKSAVAQLESAVSPEGKLSGEDLSRVRYHLAMAYFKAGDRSHGESFLAETLRSAPNLPEAKLAVQIREQSRENH